MRALRAKRTQRETEGVDIAAMRTLLCFVIVGSSSVASAQVIDPWAQDGAPSSTEPAPAPAPAPAPKPAPQPAAAPAPPPVPAPTPPPPEPHAPSTLTMRRGDEWIEHHAPIMRPRRVREPPPPQHAVDPDEVSPEPAPRKYPLEAVARPLVLPSGVAEFGLSYGRTSAVMTYRDDDGRVMTGRVSRGAPRLAAVFGISRLELGIAAAIDEQYTGWLGIDTRSFPERIGVGFAISGSRPDGLYVHRQTLAATHRVWREQSASLVAGTSVSAYQLGVRDVPIDARYFAAGGDLTFQVQLARRVALSLGVGVEGPVWHSDEIEPRIVVGASSALLIAFATWDLVGGGSMAMDAIVPGEPVLAWSAGLRKRFGL